MSKFARATPVSELLSLAGRHALITGAASGIGRAIAERFAEAGARLALVDIDRRRLNEAAASLRDRGAVLETRDANLAEKGDIERLWASFGADAPGILVNNAGVYEFRRFLDVDEPFFQRTLDINLSAVYWMCQEMIERRGKLGGVIINIGSIEAVMAFKDDLAHYSMSKAGVVALTRALAREHARHGFRVNAILPGGIVTEGTRAAARQVLRFRFDLIKSGYDFVQRLPAGRMGQPDEIARMALALASDLATYTHGAAIPVDGGFLSV